MYEIPSATREKLAYTVCVYCGSRSGRLASYGKVAHELGSAIAREKWRLVYGAGNCGLMGLVADAAKNEGGEVYGVIPVHLPEQLKPGLDSTVFTSNMNDRKMVMMVNSDAFVIMPGGFGTLDEFFETITLKQLGQHDKPVHLLNINGYWDEMLGVIDKLISEGFASSGACNLFKLSNTVPELIDDLRRSRQETVGYNPA